MALLSACARPETSTTQRTRPVALGNTRPIYPPILEASGIEGIVQADCSVTSGGTTENCHVLTSTDPLFDPSALAYVRSARYQPATLNGTPVRTEHPVFNINYTLYRLGPGLMTAQYQCAVDQVGTVQSCVVTSRSSSPFMTGFMANMTRIVRSLRLGAQPRRRQSCRRPCQANHGRVGPILSCRHGAAFAAVRPAARHLHVVQERGGIRFHRATAALHPGRSGRPVVDQPLGREGHHQDQRRVQRPDPLDAWRGDQPPGAAGDQRFPASAGTRRTGRDVRVGAGLTSPDRAIESGSTTVPGTSMPGSTRLAPVRPVPNRHVGDNSSADHPSSRPITRAV